ncbi:MAG: hypothetical protein COW34_04620, partial [Armatimonadetes bacterium CG17_big_fil_post_rev_8_21_14_2_50_66_6]
QPLLNAVAGTVLGLLFGIAVVLLLTWMESSYLRTPESVERSLAVPVLGAIPVAANERGGVAQPSGQAMGRQLQAEK